MNDSNHYRKDGAIAQLQKNFKKTSGDVSYDTLFKPIVNSLVRIAEGFLALTPEVEAGLSCGSEGYILHLCLAYLTSLTPVPGTDKRIFLPQFYGLYHIPLWRQGRIISEIADMITLDRGRRAIEAIMEWYPEPILRIIRKLGNNIRLWDHEINKLDISERTTLCDYIRADEDCVLLAVRECGMIDQQGERSTGYRDLHARLAEESWLGFHDVLSTEEKTRTILVFYDSGTDREGTKCATVHIWLGVSEYGSVASINSHTSVWHPYVELLIKYSDHRDASDAYRGLSGDQRFPFVFMQAPGAKKPSSNDYVSAMPIDQSCAKTGADNRKPIPEVGGVLCGDINALEPTFKSNPQVEFLKQLRGLHDRCTDADGDMIPDLEKNPILSVPYMISVHNNIQNLIGKNAIYAMYRDVRLPIWVNTTPTCLHIEVSDLKLAERILADFKEAKWSIALYLRVNGVWAEVMLPSTSSGDKKSPDMGSIKKI
jgi:hypothetical protein